MTIALQYTVLSGDTLSAVANGLAAAAGVSWQQIANANPGINPNLLQIGQVLNIPAAGGTQTVLRYTVMAGDSLSKIATGLGECAGMTWQQIAAANPGMNPDVLQIGQVLQIPATGNVPAPSPSPSPSPSPTPGAEQIGIWRWTWSSSVTPPAGANLGLAFSGWTDVSTALQQSNAIYSSLPGVKYITIGGGNENGAFDAASVQAVTAAIEAGSFSAYQGIAYDIETGSSGLADDFAASFAAAKQKGLMVMVTISHSAPYGISDAATLMRSFFPNSDIDFLSPQLYTTGSETQNDYATTDGVQWSEYAQAKAAVVPSIVSADMYASAQTYFASQGVTLKGFVQWSQH